MNKRLFNIHKLIGINVLLFFFISIFFGILTIFRPYVSFWEDSQKHISNIEVQNINFEKCIKEITKRKYVGEDGKVMRNDFIKLILPAKEFRSNNLIQVNNRPNFYLNPNTCKKIKPKNFTISKFFELIHYGRIFKSLVAQMIFGFAAVAVVFLCLSGVFLIIKNNYKNKKTKNLKGFFAKYHRLLLLYTLPLVFMFGLTGALFNLGIYSTPLMTNYLTESKTSNLLTVDKNILIDKDLKLYEPSQKVKTLDINTLYKKAKDSFSHISFYAIQIYNLDDINARIKFIGYEPKSFFISSVYNESYVVLNGTNAEVIFKKSASDGTFTEKTLDSVFYLHFIRTFSDIPRIIFAIICFTILFGVTVGLLLWMQRAKKDKFTYKVLQPLSYTVVLGSLISASLLFATTWLIPKQYMYFNLLNTLYNVQEVLFYSVFILIFIYIKIISSLYKVTKHSLFFSGLLLIIATLSHNFTSGFNLFKSFSLGLNEIFFTDLVLFFLGILLIYFSYKLPVKFFIETEEIKK
ncbi:PepSY domain-containing protein [Arcobacter sp.]|uniref:PepSY domain-containing protein n=1 Tax=unclassified Arcobacter TaxID=2593671 RepID=UPI003B004C1B